jgi:predicted nucleic acid-binding Zn finger protein|tara:strand:- start:222 stop:611 length:390 start_codon:yes stop_codon:yes gene_type:complete
MVGAELTAEFEKYGERFTRALELVERGAVKLHRFSPSRREIWTVVGAEGDQIILESEPFCSCRDFHFRVVGGNTDICYHLLSVHLAKRLGEKYDAVDFTDEEYHTFLFLLLQDLSRQVLLTKDKPDGFE